MSNGTISNAAEAEAREVGEGGERGDAPALDGLGRGGAEDEEGERSHKADDGGALGGAADDDDREAAE